MLLLKPLVVKLANKGFEASLDGTALLAVHSYAGQSGLCDGLHSILSTANIWLVQYWRLEVFYFLFLFLLLFL